MNTRKEQTDTAKRPRFRIEKLEERIAPKKGGLPKHCAYGYYMRNPHGKVVGSWKCIYY